MARSRAAETKSGAAAQSKSGGSADDQLSALADELYTAPPESFIANRDERVRALVGEGDKALAKAVQGLRKPTLSAWAVNLLVRSRRDQVEKFVALGPELAEAQRGLDGAALQTLASRRQRVVHALVREARELAADAGHPVGGAAAYEVESTLHAALADHDIAERLLSGRLLRPESYAGLGPLPETADRPRPAGPTPRPTIVRSNDEERREAERRVAEATTVLEEAERRSAEASAAAEEANEARQELEQRAIELREQLADVDRRIAEADLDRRRLGQLAQRAAAQAERARTQLDVAKRRL